MTMMAMRYCIALQTLETSTTYFITKLITSASDCYLSFTELLEACQYTSLDLMHLWHLIYR